jgi:hypothetical protein
VVKLYLVRTMPAFATAETTIATIVVVPAIPVVLIPAIHIILLVGVTKQAVVLIAAHLDRRETSKLIH